MLSYVVKEMRTGIGILVVCSHNNACWMIAVVVVGGGFPCLGIFASSSGSVYTRAELSVLMVDYAVAIFWTRRSERKIVCGKSRNETR